MDILGQNSSSHFESASYDKPTSVWHTLIENENEIAILPEMPESAVVGSRTAAQVRAISFFDFLPIFSQLALLPLLERVNRM